MSRRYLWFKIESNWSVVVETATRLLFLAEVMFALSCAAAAGVFTIVWYPMELYGVCLDMVLDGLEYMPYVLLCVACLWVAKWVSACVQLGLSN